MSTAGKERLDKFLFYARAIKSRTLAQKTIETGVVRVNGERTTASDHKVGPGDVLTMSLHERILVWRIVATGTRRGPAAEAALLYDDISPPPIAREQRSAFDVAIAERDPGSGRPTKSSAA
ncbi:RNA-binding S4 domain-containing protein [Devosia rhodophyticola]|uniref:RNA-binding S4 domain-containing protein n=1 Tax=Devosia rhodophyticola TaxID=3026423 RepID=A0ABY7YTP8_9HYPH|nr:RNA-binding S4 domain-containing protein [Devosia rhodophyticola]WDR04679.1 RNA-binding S4 domain-containing protein [Devosia rhodophyticola]